MHVASSSPPAPERPRVGIIGAGALGTLYAVRAATLLGDDRVTVAARGERLERIERLGLRLEGALGELHATPRVAPRLEGELDLVIVAVKAQDAIEAMRDSAPALRSARAVIVVQNGIAPLAAWPEVIGADPGFGPLFIGALELTAAQYLGDDTVTITAAAHAVLGVADDRQLAEAREAVAPLTPALDLRVRPHFRGRQFAKLAVNELNALPALTGRPVQECVAHPRLRRAAAAAMGETVRVAWRAGVLPRPIGALRRRDLLALGLLPPVLSARVPARLVRGMGEVPNLGSTLQSLKRGASSELELLSGAVARLGHELGVPTPVNDAIVALGREVQHQGRALSLGEAARGLRG